MLPCYNPPENWAGRIVDCVSRIKAELPRVIINVILVNDGFFEKEPSAELAVLEGKLPGDFQFLFYQKNMGKGFALRHGVAASKSDFCIFTDIDFPY